MNSNLKFGTYQKAEENCNKIMIPDLCQNQTQRSLLKTISIGKYGRYWTGIKRFNSTHFKGNSILSKNDLACVGSESHPVNYLRDYTRLGLSITPFTDFFNIRQAPAKDTLIFQTKHLPHFFEKMMGRLMFTGKMNGQMM